MAGFSDALLSLTSFLNTRTPDRRPQLMEGVTPAGRQALGGLTGSAGGVPGQAAKAGTAGPLAGAGAAGLTPQTLDIAAPIEPGSTDKPDKKTPAEQQYNRLGRKEARIRAREAKRLGRAAKVGAQRESRTAKRIAGTEARLGKRTTRLEGRETALQGRTQTPRLQRREAQVAKALSGTSQREATVAARGAAKEGRIAKQTAGREARITSQSDKAFNRVDARRQKLRGKIFGY